MRAIIIEDELNARDHLKSLLQTYCPEVEIVGEAHDVSSAYEIIQNVEPDLIYLDIRMPDGTGFDLLNRFREINFNVIFTTAYAEHAIDAFKFSAVHYLLKPIDPPDLMEATGKARQEVRMKNLQDKIEALFENLNTGKKPEKKIVLTTNSSIYVVNSGDIIMCQSDRNYTLFHLTDGREILVAKTIKDFDDILSGLGFFRAHRQYLVNLDYIQALEKGGGGTIRMKGGLGVPVSVRKKEQLIEILSSMA
ncbi:MAG: LytR/AlgR family response regulator transcription factor [Bacteroidales bacterium]